MKTILSIFIILHGAVHIWFVLLLNKVVKYTPDMGWTGKSWLLAENNLTRYTGTVIYLLATVLFIASSLGIMLNKAWYPTLLLISAIVSSAGILLFFDGSFQMLVQKGIIGLGINLIIIIYILQFFN
ncbi:MAG: hypothetical protein ACP5E3_06285 [Bacteroidales bacterium]